MLLVLYVARDRVGQPLPHSRSTIHSARSTRTYDAAAQQIAIVDDSRLN